VSTGRFTRFLKARNGAVLAEFAAMLPVFIALLLGGVDVARLAFLQQKLDRAAGTVGDLVSQAQTLTTDQLDDIFLATQPILEPFPTAPGVVIITSVSASNGQPPVINWQKLGGGDLVVDSQIGKPGDPPTLPQGFVVRDGETVIIAEAFYNFTPLFLPNVVLARQLYHRAMLRPRLGTLTTLN
jgi:hypothetical protein